MDKVLPCVQDCYIYSDIWNPNAGDVLNCEWESGNPIDSYAVAIKSGVSVIGHIQESCQHLLTVFKSWGNKLRIIISDTLQVYHRED